MHINYIPWALQKKCYGHKSKNHMRKKLCSKKNETNTHRQSLKNEKNKKINENYYISIEIEQMNVAGKKVWKLTEREKHRIIIVVS